MPILDLYEYAVIFKTCLLFDPTLKSEKQAEKMGIVGLMSYTASDDRVAARRLSENNSCSWPLSLLPVVKGVDPVSSVTKSTVPGSRPL